MAGKIDIDLELFHDAIGAIDVCLEDFRTTKSNMKKIIENIGSSGWESSTSNGYLATAEAWVELLDNQIVGLESIKAEVVFARDTYLGVDNELSTVYFSLA